MGEGEAGQPELLPLPNLGGSNFGREWRDGRTWLEQALHCEGRTGARQVLLDLLCRLWRLSRQRKERSVVVRYPHVRVHDAWPHVASEGTVRVTVVPLRKAHRPLRIAPLTLHGDWTAPIRDVATKPEASQGVSRVTLRPDL